MQFTLVKFCNIILVLFVIFVCKSKLKGSILPVPEQMQLRQLSETQAIQGGFWQYRIERTKMKFAVMLPFIATLLMIFVLGKNTKKKKTKKFLAATANTSHASKSVRKGAKLSSKLGSGSWGDIRLASRRRFGPILKPRSEFNQLHIFIFSVSIRTFSRGTSCLILVFDNFDVNLKWHWLL